MCINTYKGLLRNALVLGVKFLALNKEEASSYETTKGIVKNYLSNNGFNFHISKCGDEIPHIIVEVAKDMVYDDLLLQEAVVKLSNELRIKLV